MSTLTINNIVKANSLLLERYGAPEKQAREGGTTGHLVAGLMSQNTTDLNRDRAYKSLLAKFPSWESVSKAPLDKIADAIQPAGMMNQRAPRIKSLLDAIHERNGTYSADFLLEIPHEEAFAWLIKQDGIAEKTAAVFLLFQTGAPYFPVDTHIKRVLPRLGWCPDKTPAQKTQRRMTELCPPDLMHDFHMNIIALGKSLCKPRNPKCDECPIATLCDYKTP
jgi:endonuclease-3